jgi:hypothetical protein
MFECRINDIRKRFLCYFLFIEIDGTSDKDYGI